MQGSELSTAAAGRLIGISAQTVRQWCERGVLDARRIGSRAIWRVDSASVEGYLQSHPERRPTPDSRVTTELDHLRRDVDELRSRRDRTEDLLAAMERERDRFRSDAAAVREAALLLNSAAQETHEAVSHLVEVLAGQSAALAQLLSPGSPLDVLS